MGIVFDLIVIGIIGIFTFIGYKQGLLKSLIKIVSFFVAIIIAITLYKPVSRIIINKTSIDDNIKNAMIQSIKLGDKTDEDGIQAQIQNKVIGTTEVAVEETSDIITVKIIEISSLILIFIIVRIILLVITLITDLVSKLPVIKQANKLGGVIFGIIKGFVIVFTILTVVYFIAPLISENLIDAIDKSFITKILYNNNIILNFFI